MNDESKPENEGSQLPVDPRALVIGILSRWRLLPVFLVAGVLLGVVAALAFGAKTYSAETVLLYRPMPDATGEAPSLFTQLNLVKIQSNLEETNERLALGSSPGQLGAATSVLDQKNTSLLSIRVQWTDPNTAADAANTLREVFLESLSGRKQDVASSDIVGLTDRLAVVEGELQTAQAALQEFTTSRNVVDLDKEAKTSIDEMAAIETLHQQALAEKTSFDLQGQNIDRIIADLNRRVAKEQAEASQVESLGDLNIRSQRLRETIFDDKALRAGIAELTEKQLKYERAKSLRVKGLISDQDYEEAKAAYEKQNALTIDTPQVKDWKAELAKIDQSVLPSAGNSSASAPVLQAMMLRAFDIQLGRVSATEKLRTLGEARTRIKARLDAMPKLQREFASLNHEVESRQATRRDLEERLAKLQQGRDARAANFVTIAEATPPSSPSGSNRRVLFLAVLIGCIGVGGLTMVGLEAADTTVKSGADAEARFRMPLFGVLPRLKSDNDLYPSESPSVLAEPFKIIARRVRAAVPGRGAILLVASVNKLEGKTLVAANLAACLARQDERVLIIDTDVRPSEPAKTLAEIILGSDPESSVERESAGNRLVELWRATAFRIGGIGRSIVRRLADAARIKDHRREQATAVIESITEWFRMQYRRYQEVTAPAAIGSSAHAIRNLGDLEEEPSRGLGEYLSYTASSVDEVIWPSIVPGVDVLPRIGEAVLPDLLGSNRMHELLDEVSRRYSVVILDAAPVQPYVDAELLARWCDGVVLVVRSRVTTAAAVKRAVARLNDSCPRPVAGVILNGTELRYLVERDG